MVAVHVAEGDRVDAGQRLLVLEAMKMQHPVVAPGAGVVRSVLVTPGATVAWLKRGSSPVSSTVAPVPLQAMARGAAPVPAVLP